MQRAMNRSSIKKTFVTGRRFIIAGRLESPLAATFERKLPQYLRMSRPKHGCIVIQARVRVCE